MDSLTIPVSEVYGPVAQGEGPHAGRPTMFLRTGLCNLSCSWCDTPYTWDRARFDVGTECPPMTPETLAGLLPHDGTLTWTGGEPLIHQGSTAIHRVLVDYRPRLALDIETNGTITPAPWLIDRTRLFVVSPKVNPQGDPSRKRLRSAPLTAFAALARDGHAIFKVVCSTALEVGDVALLAQTLNIPARSVWIMPEGVTPDAVLASARAVEAATLDNGFSLTLRQHILIHGDRRLT